jgi:polyisoprenoid-binding protein YceI
MKTFRSFIPTLAAMLLAAAGGASAQGVLIDKSEIRFVSKQMGVNVEGRFRRWKANVDFRPGDLAHSGAGFEIDLASIDLASEESEAEVRRPSWFDTAKFPVAKFASTGIRSLGGDRYEIAGTLSLKGVAQDVVVPVGLKRDAAGNSVAEGEFKVRRLDFKVGEGIWADTDTIANDITVRVRMVLPPAR